MTIALAPTLDTSAAGPLRLALKEVIEQGQPVTLDGSAVEQTGLACLQVLVAARIAAEHQGMAFVIEQPSENLVEMASLSGVGLIAG